MTLNAYAAQQRLAVFDDLKGGREPATGEFDSAVLADGRLKGEPQMGPTRYEPHSIFFEFIYPDPSTTATVFTVRQDAPERIVFMPVPSWVVENIWQGDITGTYHFESEARRLFDELAAELEPARNLLHFGPQMAKRRE
jgi:hypothetical protein